MCVCVFAFVCVCVYTHTHTHTHTHTNTNLIKEAKKAECEAALIFQAFYQELFIQPVWWGGGRKGRGGLYKYTCICV